MLQRWGGVINGIVRNVTCKTGAEINKTFTASGSYTIPTGYTKADIFCVGGGSSGSNNSGTGGGGGGSGYTKTFKNVAVSTEQTLNIVIGAGGTSAGSGTYQHGVNNPGGTSVVQRGSETLASANGGEQSTDGRNGSSGGSAGGDPPYYGVANSPGRSDGASLPNYNPQYPKLGKGQGTTTRAWGTATGTLYAGGGGGGDDEADGPVGGAGGAGGGGKGCDGVSTGTFLYRGVGVSGTPNTGGGGGGNCTAGRIGGSIGGSGIVLLRLY